MDVQTNQAQGSRSSSGEVEAFFIIPDYIPLCPFRKQARKMKAKAGDQVKVHYTGRLKDGSVFDSSQGREPLAFQVGAGMMIKGFDAAVNGMEVGDKVTAEIPCTEAYGESREDLIFNIPKENLPADLKPEVGQQLAMAQPNGQQVPVKVKEVLEAEVIIDANHDLAGKDLIFDIELVEIA